MVSQDAVSEESRAGTVETAPDEAYLETAPRRRRFRIPGSVVLAFAIMLAFGALVGVLLQTPLLDARSERPKQPAVPPVRVTLHTFKIMGDNSRDSGSLLPDIDVTPVIALDRDSRRERPVRHRRHRRHAREDESPRHREEATGVDVDQLDDGTSAQSDDTAEAASPSDSAKSTHSEDIGHDSAPDHGTDKPDDTGHNDQRGN